MQNSFEPRTLSTGVPSTLGNWYDLCSAFFGKDSAPTLFIKGKMDEQGRDEPVVADERQVLHVLGRMLSEEMEDTAGEGKEQ